MDAKSSILCILVMCNRHQLNSRVSSNTYCRVIYWKKMVSVLKFRMIFVLGLMNMRINSLMGCKAGSTFIGIHCWQLSSPFCYSFLEFLCYFLLFIVILSLILIIFFSYINQKRIFTIFFHIDDL